MSEGMHTPGPWEATPAGVYSRADVVDNMICRLPGGFNQSVLAWPDNARLIAAAPDLLEALQIIVRGGISLRGTLKNKDGVKSIKLIVTEAIAKATEQPK